LVRPVCFFPFDDTHSLPSLLMIPIYFFTFDDTRSFWWHPLDREVRIVGIFFVKVNYRETQSVQGGVMGAEETFLFLFITRQDKTGILVSFVFHKGFFFFPCL
jgi:hypothetical protein